MTQLPIAISMGDPSGIGPDVLLQAWANRNSLALPRMLVAGEAGFLQQRAQLLGLDVAVADVEAFDASNNAQLQVVNIAKTLTGTPGEPTRDDAKATIAAIDQAVELTTQGAALGVVTAPINKAILYDAGFAHPGHTEYLAELAHRHFAKRFTPVMMLAGPQLRTIPVTIHMPLQDVSKVLSKEMIVEVTQIAHRDLINRFGIVSPRIALAGLNPHAGEGGALGREEIEIIEPAVAEMRALRLDVTGPLPADTLFHEAARKRYDVAICMYHDQALIPAKMLGFDDAVNVTLGLPFIRTSPDHGTAYDIAGTGNANPSSFIAALRLAAEMADHS